jgi:hypothetical protein
MKIKSTIDTLENDCHSKAGPRVSYSEALLLYFVGAGGQVVTVRAASPKDMQHLITQALATLEQPKFGECRHQLRGLDYSEALARWFAIDTLREFKAKVAVFATAEEALK